MYQLVTLDETVRIPPHELGEDLDSIVKRIVHQEFEGRLTKKHGLTVVITDVERVGEGRLVHGDGAVFQRVRLKALTFKPEVGEVVEGTICEVREFGAFVRFGPLDGLLHRSQILNDFLTVDESNARITGKDTGKSLALGDKVRARLVTISFNETSPRESRIGLTMRQPGLGKFEWIEEARTQEPSKGTKPSRKGKGSAGTPSGGTKSAGEGSV